MASTPKVHYAVCYQTRYGKAGVVETFSSEAKATGTLNLARRSRNGGEGLVGYVSCGSFEEAVNRAVLMETTATEGWGIIKAEGRA